MKPTKQGQIVKFHTPLENENPNQKFVILEIHQDTDRPRAKIQPLLWEGFITPTMVVSAADLEVIPADASELLGHNVFIKTSDNEQIYGQVIEVADNSVNLDMQVQDNGVNTNVLITISDAHGKKHSGLLFVK